MGLPRWFSRLSGLRSDLRFTELDVNITPAEYVCAENLHRRHLTACTFHGETFAVSVFSLSVSVFSLSASFAT